MSRVADLTTGTGSSSVVVPFVSGKRNALVIALFCDGENGIEEGFANSAESQARGALQSAGFDVSSARFVHTLDARDDADAVVVYDLHVAHEATATTETTAATSETSAE